MHRVPWLRNTFLAAAILVPVASAQAATLRLDATADRSQPTLSVSSSEQTFAGQDLANPASSLHHDVATLVADDLARHDSLASAVPSNNNIAEVNLSPMGLMVASATTAIVPEPGSIVLMAFAGMGLLAAAWRRRKRTA